jgi:hypothetical protein
MAPTRTTSLRTARPSIALRRRVHSIIMTIFIIIVIVVFIVIVLFGGDASQVLSSILRGQPGLTLRVALKVPGHPDPFQILPGSLNLCLSILLRFTGKALLLLQSLVSTD